MTSPIYIPLDSFFPVIVVGGGTCGLAVSARLCESFPGSLYTEDEHQRFHWLNQRGKKVSLLGGQPFRGVKFSSQDILVLDAVSNSFVGGWDRQFAACQIPFLRSPMFFHVDPVDVDALVCFSHDKPKELKEIKNVVGREFSKHQSKKMGAKKGKLVATNAKKGSMGANEKLSDASKSAAGSKSGSHNRSGIVDINMRDWKDYYRPSTKLFRQHCDDVIQRYKLQDCVRHDEVVSVEYTDIMAGSETGRGFVVKTASGRVYGSKACIVASGHRGEIRYPVKPFEDPHFPLGSCHTTHLFSGQVKFLGNELMDKPRECPQRTIVIVGGGLTSAQLAHVAVENGVSHVHLLLRGPVKIKHFDFHLDWVTKYRNVKKSAFYMKDTDEERYEMIQDAREGGSVNPEYHKLMNKHVQSGRLQLHTHTTITQQEWDADTLTWKLKLTNSDGKVEELDSVDYIYFATGINQNIQALSFLKPILKQAPIPTVHGFPCLTDNLQWNDEIPLFMVGKNASLKMGPSSANLDGARLGADRVGWYLQDMLARGIFDWTCECCLTQGDIGSRRGTVTSIGSGDSSDSIDSNSSSDTERLADSWRYRMAVNEMNPFSLLGEEVL